MYDVLIIGGGLAGLINAIVLSKAGKKVVLIERKMYPFHRVCGEYISNETLPFLASLDINPKEWGASAINHLQVSAPNGTLLSMPLDMGGFGISRYTLDYNLYLKAIQSQVTVITGTSVEDVIFSGDIFSVTLSDHTIYKARFVIGAYGKRAKLDKQLNRSYIHKRSPYIGVKYHIHTDFPVNHIALHNFKDGYCGLSAVEGDKYNLCYLTTRENLKKSGSIEEMERRIMQRNPFLRHIFSNSEILFEKPEVINEISFAPKTAVENHILMSGDTAGMITPLCGNGMAMAIHSAKLLSGLLLKSDEEKWSRERLEVVYTKQWKKLFAQRLWVGRNLQKLFGDERLTAMSVRLLKTMPSLTKFLISKTHGSVF
ncbi:NAD(P)/FAD-dependent oxidoreductase [Cytophagaceae bacterium DM2B3-1]|uniref:NAD(P)/FAD-dependent oxidoreductase n=1 Tax=Xanthocytophaga flava TaxID=3048013 RepID=A0ABT7CL70_9BACT|nr:NAD(P)/FAD-dependent oxidoreductase [Xanthocytophaga flavus]MDJ1468524.1 NAD(P)/FAD-dependent oxidoreductase [Xanthocytophaga flavus]MDJ1493419.1 NAD(P)/FAD-dependent oxidoreductase [Xanthocytophaga flavus]